MLREAWLGGRKGKLTALEQARAWALREVWREEKTSTYGMYEFIAGRVTKVGGGHPQAAAVQKLLEKVDEDDEWFPGKSAQVKNGPARVVTPRRQAIVARAAMAMHVRGEQPTYAKLVATCPHALENPQTKEAVDKKRVYSIMRERCYDDPEGPDDLWTHGPRHSKEALTETAKRLRLSWAQSMQAARKTPAWYYNNLMWTDICNTILPRTEKNARRR